MFARLARSSGSGHDATPRIVLLLGGRIRLEAVVAHEIDKEPEKEFSFILPNKDAAVGPAIILI